MRREETKIRVRYGETDQMGVAYHANYLTWCEIGRTEWIRSLGYPYSEFEKRGVLLPVLEAHLSYLLPARYDDEVTVDTWLSFYTGVRLTFSYEIFRKEMSGEKILLASGYTKHGWVNRDFRPVPLKKIWPEVDAVLRAL
ncbi:putative enzyme [[Clostridium] ultunense Esp]|uniref:acyl-CoA thioesterase n=1 Tax=Thermicanus aegyptius TaxID=94009 RepID=UPI0002B6FAFC|nr:thioesterase family protein [Thermicanus aegyptius]CCQ97763.1 putative enzyme [[Clostridium] ultunense Esp]